MTDTPNVGLPLVPENTLDPAAGLNRALIEADALIQTAVISMALSAPPGSPADGDLYIVAGPGTGAWATLDDYLVRYVAEGAFWQSYAPGKPGAHLALNLDDGGLYAFIDSSGWQPITGASAGSISVEDQDTGGDVIATATTIVIGDGLQVTDMGGGVALIEAIPLPPPVVTTESGTSRNAAAADANTYVRFTNAATKTYTFNNSAGFTAGQEFSGRNAGAGALTIAGAGSMVITAPAGGTLVIPQNATFTVKIVTSTTADLIGATT
jgi:hypothetical protein